MAKKKIIKNGKSKQLVLGLFVFSIFGYLFLGWGGLFTHATTSTADFKFAASSDYTFDATKINVNNKAELKPTSTGATTSSSDIIKGSNWNFDSKTGGPMNDGTNLKLTNINTITDPSTTFLMHGNEPILTDTSGSYMTNSANGSKIYFESTNHVTQDNVLTKFGSPSLKFDGSNTSWMATAGSSNWDFGGGDFTIDFWFNYDFLTSYVPILSYGVRGYGGNCNSMGAGGFTNRISSWIVELGPDNMDFLGCLNNNALQPQLFNSDAYADTSPGWHHAAIVRSGDNLLFFEDGQSIGTQTINGSLNSLPMNLSLYVGYTTYLIYKGNLSEIRISKGTARWTDSIAGFPTPTTPYPTLSSIYTANQYFSASQTTNAVDWGAISSASDTLNNASVYYSFNFNNSDKFKIFDGTAWKDIVQNASTKWQYWDGTIWQDASPNDKYSALDSAIAITTNQMKDLSEATNHWNDTNGFDVANSNQNIETAITLFTNNNSVTPSVSNFKFNYTNTTYPNDNPTIVNNIGQHYDALTSFSENKLGSGSIGYQISNNGTDWYWWDAIKWVKVASDSNRNTFDIINTNIATFASSIGNGDFYFKAFLISDGTQAIGLNSVSVGYVINTPTPSGGGGSGGGSTTTAPTYTEKPITPTPTPVTTPINPIAPTPTINENQAPLVYNLDVDASQASPILKFTTQDPGNNNLKYEIQVSDQGDYSNILMDYTSDIYSGDQKDIVFTIGQDNDNSGYTKNNQINLDGFYWRVKVINTKGVESEFVNYLFTKNPSEQSTISPDLLKNNVTPTTPKTTTNIEPSPPKEQSQTSTQTPTIAPQITQENQATPKVANTNTTNQPIAITSTNHNKFAWIILILLLISGGYYYLEYTAYGQALKDFFKKVFKIKIKQISKYELMKSFYTKR